MEAGNKYQYCSLSNLFGVGLSTVCVVVSDVCSAIVEHLASRYIAIPAGERLKLVVDGFMSKWGVPQCIGAIDSTHIPIIASRTAHGIITIKKGTARWCCRHLLTTSTNFLTYMLVGQEASMMHEF